MTNLETFGKVYTEQLHLAVASHPEEYIFAGATVDQVVAKMIEAFAINNYNLSGRAIRNTCKVLGIKNTRTAINAYVKGE